MPSPPPTPIHTSPKPILPVKCKSIVALIRMEFYLPRNMPFHFSRWRVQQAQRKQPRLHKSILRFHYITTEHICRMRQFRDSYLNPQILMSSWCSIRRHSLDKHRVMTLFLTLLKGLWECFHRSSGVLREPLQNPVSQTASSIDLFTFRGPCRFPQ